MHNSVDPDLPVLRNPDHEWLHTTGVRFNSESHWQSQWHTITDRPDLFRQCHPADYMKNEPGQNVSYHIEIVNPGSANGKILKFNASQTIGAITTNASVDILDGVTNYYSFGGSGNFGDITTSFSKSKMYQTERLFGQIEYLSGNTKASAQLTQITSPNANVTAMATMFSCLDQREGFLDKYLRVGAGSVTGA